jgi:hypothetical protein
MPQQATFCSQESEDMIAMFVKYETLVIQQYQARLYISIGSI